MAIYKEDIADIELETGNVHRVFLRKSIGTGDSAANRFGIRLFRNGEPVNVGTATVQGYFRDPQGNNIAITGSTYTGKDGNKAWVTLPAACYNYEGPFCLAIKLVRSTEGIAGTMRIVDGVVDNTHTGGAVAPTDNVPTYEEILDVYDEMLETLEAAVRYDEEQELTDEEQAQARENIGAASAADQAGSVRFDKEQTLSTEEQAQARENIDAVGSEDLEEEQKIRAAGINRLDKAISNELGLLPAFDWQSVGMYTATGIQYADDDHASSPFIDVTGSDEIVVYMDDTTYPFALFEFASNDQTTSSTNNRLKYTSGFQNGTNRIKLTSQTNYIRIMFSTAKANVPGLTICASSGLIPSDIAALEARADALEEKVIPTFVFARSLFANKAWNINGGWSSANDRISNINPLLFPYDVTIQAASGYSFLILGADGTGDVIDMQYGVWMTEFTVPANYRFYVTVRITAGGNISISDAPTAITATIDTLDVYTRENITDLDSNPIAGGEQFIKKADTLNGETHFFIQRTDVSGRVFKILNPYAKRYKNQYMGQLHDHSWTVGEMESQHTQANVEALYAKYKILGYDFMTITNYTYFDDLTPCPVADDSDLIWLCNSYEQAVTPTVTEQNQYTHLVCLNAPHVYSQETIRDGTVANTVIEALLDDGVIVTLAHPMWWASSSNQTQYTAAQLLALTERLKYVEIYNTYSKSGNESPYVSNSAYALDVLASDGRIVWGVAVSDSHQVGTALTRTNYDGNIKVFAPEKTRSAIWNSYLEGNFYCCEKIENRLNSIRVENNVITIDIGDTGATTKFIGKDATTLSTVSGAVASYKITGAEMYVRAEITLSNGSKIWTNPVYITSDLVGE